MVGANTAGLEGYQSRAVTLTELQTHITMSPPGLQGTREFRFHVWASAKLKGQLSCLRKGPEPWIPRLNDRRTTRRVQIQSTICIYGADAAKPTSSIEIYR